MNLSFFLRTMLNFADFFASITSFKVFVARTILYKINKILKFKGLVGSHTYSSDHFRVEGIWVYKATIVHSKL